MRIKEITDKNVWENFLISVKEKTFLQSWNWGEFQKMMGNKIWRLGVFEKDELISIALIVKITAKRGTFLFLPHGPIGREQRTENREQILKVLTERLKELAKKEGVSFVRVSPIWERNPVRNASRSDAGGEENMKIFRDLGFRKAPIHMHPEVTWQLDILPSEEKLLMQMRKTTRYLIRQAQKNEEIEIFQSQKLEDVEIFNNLHQEVVKRQHFTPFSLNYFKKEFLVFNPDNQPIRQGLPLSLRPELRPRVSARSAQGCPECTEGQISLFFGKYKNEILASAIIVFWQGIAFYHHGASSLKYSKIPVSYLLQWEAIREAKKRGCSLYNFWGIAPEGSSKKPRINPFGIRRGKHPWTGLTLFKKGFGGYTKECVKTQDLVLSPKYWLNWGIEKMRHKKRGF